MEILCVGRLKERYWTEAVAEYTKRLQSFCKLRITEIPECRVGDRPTGGEIEKVLETEGNCHPSKNLSERLCDPNVYRGKIFIFRKVGGNIAERSNRWKSQVCFVIGGSFGLSDAVKRRGDLRLSVSAMTFPHQLFRIMLLEQIYRAFSINAHTQYHK